LDAVAITDHHDIAFFPYIRDAALAEQNASGNPLPANTRIVVFPGVELTLAVPCQAILLFNPDTDFGDMERGLAAIGIPKPPEGSVKTNPVTRLTIDDLNEICKRLNEHMSLKDRFILLPNVNDGGSDTILRAGFFECYKNMVCVGGYSQKQLSHVSVRSKELVRLLTIPIAQELSNLDAEIQSEANTIKEAYGRVERHRTLQAQLQTMDLDLVSKREQINSLSDQVRDLPGEQRKEITAHPLYMEGKRLATAYRSSIETAESTLVSGQASIQKVLSELPAAEKAQPLDALSAVKDRITGRLNQIVSQLEALAKSVYMLREETRGDFEGIAQEITEHTKKYDAAASENAVIQERLDSLRTISSQIAETERGRDSLTQDIAEVAGAGQALQESRSRWVKAIDNRNKLLESQAVVLTQDSNGELQARVARGQNIDHLRAAIQDAIRGAGITTPEKLEKLLREVVFSIDPLAAWLEVGEELIALARVGPQLPVGADLPSTPRMDAAGFIPSELRRTASKLRASSTFELTLCYPESVPIFEYRTNDGTYVPFQDASPGQQATALIGLLMNQSAGPLVIDQPEDDLDNSTILKIAERLWNAKEKRQIIFSTHNPNLVVIGDGELVIYCAYRQPVQGARVEVANQGAIDNKNVCDILKRVMEGGAEAFMLRKQKYGF
jgi:type III restriction enzyme